MHSAGTTVEEWLLDSTFTFLNHGSYGATPRCVLAEQDRWRARMESHPTGFMTYELPYAVRDAATRLAHFIDCDPSDLAFIENATTGCSIVLNSIAFSPGDEILITNHAYAAVRLAVEHVARKTGAIVVEADVPFPIICPHQAIDAVSSCLGERTRLVVIDHITSPTGVVFPVCEIIDLSREADAFVLVDGAHAPGMLPLQVSTLRADWYVGNCHKWLMAPKGSAFLWTDRRVQSITHPLSISHGYGQGYAAEFDWPGTRDPSAWLAVSAAIDFVLRLGGQSHCDRNVVLACEAASYLARTWGTLRGTPDHMTGSMAAVRLPVRGPATRARALQLQRLLFESHRVEVAITPFGDALWARISAQAYNTISDYERLGRVIIDL